MEASISYSALNGFVLGGWVTFLCALRVKDYKLYRRILAGERCWDEVGRFLGLGMKGEDVQTLLRIVSENRIPLEQDQENLKKGLFHHAGQWSTKLPWNATDHSFSRVARRIEESLTLKMECSRLSRTLA